MPATKQQTRGAKAGGRISVSFKPEGPGEIGPVIVIEHDAYDEDPEIVKSRKAGGFGLPFGYKPQGMNDLGWKSRREALAIAGPAHGLLMRATLADRLVGRRGALS